MFEMLHCSRYKAILSSIFPCSGLCCPHKANLLEAWCKHTINDRLKLSLSMWSIEYHSRNLHKLCIYQVREYLPGGGKVHLKCSNKKLVKANFALLKQKRFVMLMWYQARWFGRRIKIRWGEADSTCVAASTRFNVGDRFSTPKEA